MDARRILERLLPPFGLLAAVYVGGVAGYMFLEGWNFEDASYMTVITVATVGFGETHPLSPVGRWFTIALILGGMGTMLYAVSSLTAFIVEGELAQLLRRGKMDKAIARLEGHFVICGAGRVGSVILKELRAGGHKTVVVDRSLERLEETFGPDHGLLTVEGDATHDAVLERAGIRRARGLLAALAEDRDNLFVVLSARSMNPALRIVARADEESTRDKLFKAGADAVVFPHTIGGLRMASEMLRPAVVTFLDQMLRWGDGSLRVEEAVVSEGSPLAGQRLSACDIPGRTGALLVALKTGGQFLFNPAGDRTLSPGDVLVVIADRSQREALQRLASGT
jgi:voltage-gated potassium channel